LCIIKHHARCILNFGTNGSDRRLLSPRGKTPTVSFGQGTGWAPEQSAQNLTPFGNRTLIFLCPAHSTVTIPSGLSVGIATNLRDERLTIRGSIPSRSKRAFTSPLRPHWRLLFNGYLGSSPWGGGGYSSRGVKLTSHLHVVEVKNGGGIPALSHTSSWRCA
jgi:hypothetical protein